MEFEWDSFFNNLSSFILNISQREGERNTNVAESVVVSIQSYLRVLYAIKDSLSAVAGDRELVDIVTTLSSLIDDVEEIYSRWTSIEAGIEVSYCLHKAPRVNTGRGRPKVVIEQQKIEFLRELRFSWTQIAAIFGVCRRTLYSIRSEQGIMGDEYNFTHISDQELRDHIQSLKKDMPEIGYNMMKGVLRSQGIHVTIPRIQQCISEIDPINTALRWAAPTSRRHYSVPYSNFIWHLDGNHKLVRFVRILHIG